MTKQKNNHYVPQFHLRNWSYNETNISLYNKHNKKFIDKLGAIKNLASKDYLYGKDSELEDFFSKIESIMAPVYKKLFETKRFDLLTSDEIECIYLYISLCKERTLETAESRESQIKEFLRVRLNMEHAHGKNLNISTDILDSVKIENAITSPILTAVQYYPLLLDLGLILIKNTSETQFITADYPVIHYNHLSIKRSLYSGWGMCSCGAMYILPISPQYAIMAYDSVVYDIPNLNKNLLIIKQKGQIDEINKLMFLNSYKNIFFSENINLHYINKISKNLPCNTSDKTTTFESPESSLIVVSGKRIQYDAKFTFVKINQNFMDVPMPAHAQGALRPLSEQMNKKLSEYWKKEKSKMKSKARVNI